MKNCTRMAIVLVLACVAAGASKLPFVNDDYAKALMSAKERKLPIFAEVWAPW
jgi:hypothetical protein